MAFCISLFAIYIHKIINTAQYIINILIEYAIPLTVNNSEFFTLLSTKLISRMNIVFPDLQFFPFNEVKVLSKGL